MRKPSSSGPSKRPASGNTFKKSSGSKAGGYGDKYPKKREEKEGSDKPYKSREDKPKRSFGEDRPKRSFGEDRPKGKPGDRSDRPFDKPKRDYGDKPRRSFGDDRPKRDFGDKPKRSFGDDRPKRDFGDKPKRSFGEDRPARKFDDTDRPKRAFGDNKPKKDFGDRPFKKKFDEGDKPKRSFGEDRPIKKFENRSRSERKSSDDKPQREFGDKPYKKREEGDKPKGSSFGEYRAKGKFGDKDKAKRSFGEDRPKKDYGDKPKRSFGEDRPKKDYGDSDKPKKKFDKAPEKKKFGDDIFKPEPKKDKIEKTVSELEGFTKSLEEDKPIRGFIANAKKDRPEAVARKKYEEGKPKKYHNDELDEEDDEEMEEEKPQSDLMPLNKFIAHSGECSRREAAELVKKGKVKVNGELVTDPGHKVSISDTVSLVGKKLTLQKEHVYVLLNKPKDFITTTDDPEGRKTVMDLIAGLGVERVYPVGRLDRNTTGLLLLTNDGDLAQKLSHPSYSIKKVYQVTLDKALTKADFDKIIAGVELEDGIANVDEMAYLEKKNEIGLEIHSGKNRIVRRIFESLGYTVEKLDRMMYAGLTKKNLPRSKWRLLTDKEIIVLKHFKG